MPRSKYSVKASERSSKRRRIVRRKVISKIISRDTANGCRAVAHVREFTCDGMIKHRIDSGEVEGSVGGILKEWDEYDVYVDPESVGSCYRLEVCQSWSQARQLKLIRAVIGLYRKHCPRGSYRNLDYGRFWFPFVSQDLNDEIAQLVYDYNEYARLYARKGRKEVSRWIPVVTAR